MKYQLFFLLLMMNWLTGQIRNVTDNDSLVIDHGNKDSIQIFHPSITDYQFYTILSKKKNFDTAFITRKSYELTQYNNQDYFGKIQFANIGSGFQNLVYGTNPEQDFSILPTNKSHFIISPDEVRYYDVKTPVTRFIYHNGMNQGAALQSTYTQNFGKNLNITAEYMGLRSKGFYTNSLASNNNTIFSAHYHSPNKKYEVFTHYLHQNVNNQENGGITDLPLFTSGDSRFRNRANLAIHLRKSDSRFSYRRYFLSHSFRPFLSKEFPFKIKHTLFHQGNKYFFNIAPQDVGKIAGINEKWNLGSKKFSDNLSNTLNVMFDHEHFSLEGGIRHQYLTLGYIDTETSREILQRENRIGLMGRLEMDLWDKISLNSFLELSRGGVFGNSIRSENRLKFEPVKNYFVDAKLNYKNTAPSFNWMVNSSAVPSYNYDIRDFKNESILEMGGSLGLKWFNTKIFAKYFRVDNYAYFNSELLPKQSSTSLNISQIGGESTIGYRHFYFNAKVLFQNHLTNKSLYPVPNVIGRANFYWKNKLFKNAAEVMGGIKAYYFSRFASRDFSPILNEFILPNEKAYVIGGYPIADIYLNFKVKTMQVYIEAQHFTTPFIQNQSYTAPYYPIYDFRLNIGIIWTLFH